MRIHFIMLAISSPAVEIYVHCLALVLNGKFRMCPVLVKFSLSGRTAAVRFPLLSVRCG